MTHSYRTERCILLFLIFILGLLNLLVTTNTGSSGNRELIQMLGDRTSRGYLGISDTPNQEDVSVPLQYIYQGESGDTPVMGKKFTIANSLLSKYAYLLRDFVSPTKESIAQFVFVMGVSSSHFSESLDAVGSFQQHFPHRRLFYYDWGLTPGEKSQVSSWCRVTLMDFDFEVLPYVRKGTLVIKWHYQVAKAFVIAETLKTYPAVFWMDSSVRLQTNKLGSVYSLAADNSGIVFFGHNWHSTYVVTPPEMYQYLPTSMWRMKTADHVQTGAMMIVRSKEVMEHVYWWYMLCCLQEACIHPAPYTTRCTFQGEKLKSHDRANEFSNCSRFDQSVMNIVVGNFYEFDVKSYCATNCSRRIIKIARRETHFYPVQVCGNQTTLV